MKIKLKNPAASSSAASPVDPPPPPPPAADAAPVAAKPGGGLKIKFKPAASTPSTPTAAAPAPTPAPAPDADAPKLKRKYTKKPKPDDAAAAAKPSKRARDDSNGAAPHPKRKPKPTAKSLAMADDSDDDDDDNDGDYAAAPAPTPVRHAHARQQSIKLSIKPKGPAGAAGAGPHRASTAILKVKGAGKPPYRPPGVGYDSEAEEAEPDPAIESQFVLRMPPGPDCDLLRKSIEEKTIGRTTSQGGPGVYFRFFDREGRRAMVTIQGRNYAASMVELPNIIESMKSWNKKDWVKTADVCQMLLVLGRVQSEEEAKKYPRPSYIEDSSHRFPHGLTPPMRWVRKRRFRPRKSYLDVERAEAEMNRLLADDDNAEGTKYELIDEGHITSDESGSDGEDEDMADAPVPETPMEEVDAAALEELLHAGFMEDDDLEIQADGDELDALFGNTTTNPEGQTPVTAHNAAMHALTHNGNLVLEPETTASSPAAATSAEDDDDDDDDDDSDDDEVDEAAAAELQRREQLEAEIAELEKAIQQSIEQRDKHSNGLFKTRMNKTIERQKQDLVIKKKQLNENEDLDD